jgi:ACR3 family arsenite transporter
MNIFEKYVSVWIALAMGAGILLGNVAPGLVKAIATAEVVHCPRVF